MKAEYVLPPFTFYFAGALLTLFLPKRLGAISRLLLVVAAFGFLNFLPHGVFYGQVPLAGYRVLMKVDALSLAFAYVFVIISFGALLYSLHVKEKAEHFWAMCYAGSGLGVVFAADWLSFYLFWELMAICAAFLIWSHGTRGSLSSGFRYLMVHLFGGICFLSGIVWLKVKGHPGIVIHLLQADVGFPYFLVLTSFLLNAAAPPLHAWLPDAYPEASPTGAIYLTAYTTKASVYALLRVFPGEPLLAWIGALMALYGVVWAIIQNDIRRLLSYHIVSQVGYMVCGVGLGTALSMSGSVAHAFTHILYKALLFMGAGAVIASTGLRHMSDLMKLGLFGKLPIVFLFYMVGAFSISSVPLFSGFISKPMIVEAALEGGHLWIYIMLHLASVGTWLCTAFKLPYYTWFGPNGKNRQLVPLRPLPLSMYVGMSFLALLCILLGVVPSLLYRLLPYPFHFNPYSPRHIVDSLQLLSASALCTWMLLPMLKPHPFRVLDMDVFYRMLGRWTLWICKGFYTFRTYIQGLIRRTVEAFTLLGKNPLSLLYALSGKSAPPYEANTYRLPLSFGMTITMLFFSFLALMLMLRS